MAWAYILARLLTTSLAVIINQNLPGWFMPWSDWLRALASWVFVSARKISDGLRRALMSSRVTLSSSWVGRGSFQHVQNFASARKRPLPSSATKFARKSVICHSHVTPKRSEELRWIRRSSEGLRTKGNISTKQECDASTLYSAQSSTSSTVALISQYYIHVYYNTWYIEYCFVMSDPATPADVVGSDVDVRSPRKKRERKQPVRLNFTPREEAELAVWVEDHPILYNSKLEEFRDRSKKIKLYEEKAKEFPSKFIASNMARNRS